MANVIDGEFRVIESELKSLQGRAIAKYSDLVSDTMLAEYREKFTGLSADTKEGYEEVRKAIAVCRTTRTGIDKKRKELTEEAREWVDVANSVAKRLITALEAIEEPLKAKKQAVDDERERVKAEAEAARARKINDRLSRFTSEAGRTCSVQEAETWTDDQFESALTIARDAHQANLKAKQEAEAERQRIEAEKQEAFAKQQQELREQRAEMDRLKAEQQAEIDRIREEQEAAKRAHEAELARIQAEQAEKDRIEREKIETERAALQAEKDRIEAEEIAKQEKARQAEEAARVEAQQKASAERAEQHRIEEQKRIEALRPDLEKIEKYKASILNAVESVERPSLQSESLSVWLEDYFVSITRLVVAQNPQGDFSHDAT